MRGRRSAGGIRIGIAAACFALGQPPAGADTLIVTSVAANQQETPIGGRYLLMGDVAIDGLRRVTFTASTSQGRNGVFRTRRGAVTPLVVNGDEAPPGAGTVFHVFLESASNARGDVAFVALTLPSQRSGLFILSDGEVRTVTLQGADAPVPEGGTFLGFDQVYLLDSGDLYFGGILLDLDGLPTRAVLRAGPGGRIDPVIAPGDRYMGARSVLEVLQFEVNQAGDVAALVVVGEPQERLDEADFPREIVLHTGAGLRTLASIFGEVNRLDVIRFFAVTFDQVNLNDAGATSFFAGSNFFPLGSLYANFSAAFFDNERLLGQGDPSPVAPTDRFAAFGAFALNGAETLVFHATTRALPSGGIFLRRGGTVTGVARVGGLRPGATGVFSGFRRVELNEEDAFVFTDFQFLANVGVFLGRFLPPPDVVLQRLRDALEDSGVVPGAGSGLLARVETLARLLGSGEIARMLRQAALLRTELDALSGHALSVEQADRIDLHLEDLIAAVWLAASSADGPSLRRGPLPRRLTGPRGRD